MHKGANPARPSPPLPSGRARAPRYLLAVVPVPHQAHLPVAALPHGPEEAVSSQGHGPVATPPPRSPSAPGAAARARPAGSAPAAAIATPRGASAPQPFWKRVGGHLRSGQGAWGMCEARLASF